MYLGRLSIGTAFFHHSKCQDRILKFLTVCRAPDHHVIEGSAGHKPGVLLYMTGLNFCQSMA